jgi:hypothetical protein
MKLLDQVRDVLRKRHYSIRTEQAYVDWIKRYIFFYGKRHPQEMDPGKISLFLTHLATGRNVAASTRNQALYALGFLQEFWGHHDSTCRQQSGGFGLTLLNIVM